jgi:hypothetical protein
MSVSTTASAVPRYVELAPSASTPKPNTAGALLRDYLAILAFHFERSGESYSSPAVDTALAALPGLLLQGTLRTDKEIAVTTDGMVTGAAGIVANEWGAQAGSPELLALIQPMITGLSYASRSAPADQSLQVTLIVLQRPAAGAPTLGAAKFSLDLRQSGGAGPQGAPPRQSLSIGCVRTTYTVVDQQLAQLQQFVSDLRAQGVIADLSDTAGYVSIPLK